MKFLGQTTIQTLFYFYGKKFTRYTKVNSDLDFLFTPSESACNHYESEPFVYRNNDTGTVFHGEVNFLSFPLFVCTALCTVACCHYYKYDIHIQDGCGNRRKKNDTLAASLLNVQRFCILYVYVKEKVTTLHSTVTRRRVSREEKRSWLDCHRKSQRSLQR